MTDVKEIIDPDYCGLEPLTTGKRDPFWKTACQTHDERMTRIKLGESAPSKWVTARDFGEAIIVTTAENVARATYSVLAAPVYILIGGVGGYFRQWYLERQKR